MTLLTKRDLLLVLANVPDEAWIEVLDDCGHLRAPRAELNVVPPLVDHTGMSNLAPQEIVRVILVPNDRVGPAWPAGTTVALSHPFASKP